MEQNSNYRVLSNVCVSCGVRIPDIDFEIKPAMRKYKTVVTAFI